MDMSLKLNVLRGRKNSSRKRVGRGIGSGRGKTSSRGMKGQKSRAGSSVNKFEGGQQSIIIQLPKRGMHRTFVAIKKRYQCVNVYNLQKLFDEKKISSDMKIDAQVMHQLGLVSSLKEKVKLLGHGDLSAALVLEVDSISEGARNIVEKAGGKVTIL